MNRDPAERALLAIRDAQETTLVSVLAMRFPTRPGNCWMNETTPWRNFDPADLAVEIILADQETAREITAAKNPAMRPGSWPIKVTTAVRTFIPSWMAICTIRTWNWIQRPMMKPMMNAIFAGN
jgi:hypothetical protein